MKTGFKRYQKHTSNYWINRGLSIEEANKEALKYVGTSRRSSPGFYLLRKLANSQIEAEQMANDWIKNKCSLRKENYIKRVGIDKYTKQKKECAARLKGKRPTEIVYWLNQGLAHDDAVQKVSQIARQRSKRCPEYWIYRGYTKPQANKKISEYQNSTSLQAFTSKYGEVEGTLKYELLCEIRSDNGKKYSKFNDKDFQNTIKQNKKSNKEYWINRGFDPQTAAYMAHEHLKLHHRFFKEYWMGKGLNSDDAQTAAVAERKRTASLGFEALSQGFSKLERDIGNTLREKYTVEIPARINDSKLHKSYYPDFYIKEHDCYLEIYGDYWHRHPDKYKDAESEIIRNQNQTRVNRITEITGKRVIIVWEKDMRKISNDSIIKFISNIL